MLRKDGSLEAAFAGGCMNDQTPNDDASTQPEIAGKMRIADPVSAPSIFPNHNPIAFWSRMAVVTSTFNSPASMLCRVRMFKSAFSAKPFLGQAG
jgi:hypothetical protein